MATTTVPALVIRRALRAKPERVYQAWTDPVLARQFICPETVTIPEATMDVRVGGSYHIVMQKEDGEQLHVRGVYREVRPNEKLVMTWKWDEDDPKDEYETLLTLDFKALDGGTELTLTHEYFATEQSRANHEHGWNQIVDKLAEL